MLCIVVSGQVCAGSSSLARTLAKELQYDYFSVGDFVRQELVAAGDVTLSEAYAPDGVLSDDTIQRRVDERQIERAKLGSVVIDSKLGLHVLSGRYDFGIWLSANRGVRAQRLAIRSGMPFENALVALLMREAQEKSVWSNLYGTTVLRLHEQADIIINTSNISVQEVNDLVLKRLNDLPQL